MRLWSIHPCYLDSRGLVALWREGLLAQKVIQGTTAGYRNHPQLRRFRNTPDPSGAIAQYLGHIADEADSRGYRFDRNRIINRKFEGRIPVTTGQIRYEFQHLLNKLKQRSPELHEQLKMIHSIKLNPVMLETTGEVEDWERI